MGSSFLIPAFSFLFCLSLRCVYELLKEGHKINTESRPIFIAIFSVMMVFWVSWFVLCPADPLHLRLPDPVRWTGFGIFILGTLLAVGALIQLRGVENIDHLVTGGLFRKLRHPMYVGFIFWLIGWSVYHAGRTSMTFALLGISAVLWWRRLEEARLEIQFGDAYREYRKTSWF